MRRGVAQKNMEGAAVARAPSIRLEVFTLVKTRAFCLMMRIRHHLSIGPCLLAVGYFFLFFLEAFFVAFLVALFFLRLAISVTSFQVKESRVPSGFVNKKLADAANCFFGAQGARS